MYQECLIIGGSFQTPCIYQYACVYQNISIWISAVFPDPCHVVQYSSESLLFRIKDPGRLVPGFHGILHWSFPINMLNRFIIIVGI